MRYEFRPVAACVMCGSDEAVLLGLRLNSRQGFRPRSAEGIAVSIKRCRPGGLIYSAPQPVPAELADHYGIPPDDYWRTIEPWSPAHYEKQVADARRLLPYRTGMTCP